MSILNTSYLMDSRIVLYELQNSEIIGTSASIALNTFLSNSRPPQVVLDPLYQLLLRR
jgi:hypothetical protein